MPRGFVHILPVGWEIDLQSQPYFYIHSTGTWTKRGSEFRSKSDIFPTELRRTPIFQSTYANRSKSIKISSFFIMLETDGQSPHEKFIFYPNYHILKSEVCSWLSQNEITIDLIEFHSIQTLIFKPKTRLPTDFMWGDRSEELLRTS